MQFPDFRLDEQVAIVTGASTGIGRGVALALANAGAHVVVTSRATERAEPVAAEIRALGRKALPVAVEITSLESIDALVAAVEERFGRIDILINNAGINIPELAVDVTEAHWDRVLDTNLKGLFFCSQRVGRIMLAQGRGKIVNIASQMGLVGGRLRAAYCASKGGVVQLTKVLAIEWSHHGVNVNAVAPTFLRTPLTEPMFEDEAFYQEVLSTIPMGRIGAIEDVLGAVVFLVSPAAAFITGHTLLVDGGWTAW
jgi:NAD(P)-dependent dehydrogenase (short-subunit alcohol dehydrogenase family)